MEQEVNNLKRRIDELEKALKNHNHRGYDNSNFIEGHIRMKKDKFFTLGNVYLANPTTHEGESNEADRMGIACGQDSDLGIGNKSLNTQLLLEHHPNDLLSFLYGYRPPLYSGPRSGDTIAITATESTISDTKQTFTTDALANCYITIVGRTTSTLETHLIASNTATQITIADTWGISENVDYLVFLPMYLGAANFPWKRLYIMDDIRFGKGASAGADVIFIKHGEDSPEGVVTANVGSLYLNRTGGNSTTLYVKENGTGNTGWAAAQCL